MLTGKTNVWLAVQLTNVSIILYFVWAAAYFWNSDLTTRIFVALFCSGVLYALTLTVFKVPIEEYENNAYGRVAKGYRNPRRVRDAMLRWAFLTLCVVLWYPIFFVYVHLHLNALLLFYLLIVLTTALLYLLACDPLPPCAGRVREWLRGFAFSRVAPEPSRPRRPVSAVKLAALIREREADDVEAVVERGKKRAVHRHVEQQTRRRGDHL